MTGKRSNILRLSLLLVLILIGIVSPRAQVGLQQGSPAQAGVQQAQVTVGTDIVYFVLIRVQSTGENIGVAVPVLSPDTGMSTPAPVPGTPMQTRSYSYSNGRSVYLEESRYIYTIKTTKEGRFQIPPATVTIGGKNIETQAVDVTVVSAPQVKDLPAELKGLVVPPAIPDNPDLQAKLTGAIFIIPVLSTNTPYNGEQVRIAYHLVIDPKALQQAGIQPMTNLQNIAIPPMTDFIKEELYPFPQDIKFEEREIGGRTYSVAPIYEAVISSTKTGSLGIEPFQISMGFTMRGSRRAFPDFPDDPFFAGSPFGMLSGNSINVVAQSPLLSLEVKPIPTEGRPANYNGAVGSFTVTAQVDKKQAKAYEDTIRLDVSISSEGNADTISPPALPPMDGFTVLGEPEQETGGRKEGKQYISTKRFTYNLRPTKPGDFQIPPVSISAFDPASQSFKDVESDPIAIKVLPGSRPIPPPDSTPAAKANADEPAPKPAEKDYRYIYTGALRRQARLDSFFDSPLVYALFALPVAFAGAALGAAAYRRRTLLHASDSNRKNKAGAIRHLRNARAALDAAQSDAAIYAHLAEGIRLHFASRYAIPLGEATIQEIEQRLHASGMPADKLHQLTGLLERCDTIQYAPNATGASASADIALAETLIRESEKYS